MLCLGPKKSLMSLRLELTAQGAAYRCSKVECEDHSAIRPAIVLIVVKAVVVLVAVVAISVVVEVVVEVVNVLGMLTYL